MIQQQLHMIKVFGLRQETAVQFTAKLTAAIFYRTMQIQCICIAQYISYDQFSSLSGRLSDTRRYCIKKAKRIIMQSMLYGRISPGA